MTSKAKFRGGPRTFAADAMRAPAATEETRGEPSPPLNAFVVSAPILHPLVSGHVNSSAWLRVASHRTQGRSSFRASPIPISTNVTEEGNTYPWGSFDALDTSMYIGTANWW